MGLLPAASSLGTLVLELTADGRAYFKEMKAAENEAKDVTDQIVKYFKYAGAAVLATMAAVATMAIKEFAQFDATISKSLAFMRGVTGNMRKEMADTAREMARHGISSAEEIAGAYGILAKNGLNAAQSIKAIEESEKFATATRTELAEATNSLAGAQLALGMSYADPIKNAQEMARLSDILIMAQREGGSTAGAYADALKGRLAVILKSTNKDVTEGVAAVMVLNRTFQDTGESASALALMLQTMQKSARENKEIWKAFGLEVFDSNGKMKSLSDISSQFNKLLGDMTDTQKEETLSMLGFNTRTLAAVNALSQAGDQVDRFQKALKGASGITEEMADERLKSLTAQTILLQHSLNDLMLDIGEQLMPVIKVLNTALSEFVRHATDGTSGAKELGGILRDVGITVVGMAADVIAGWKVIITGGQIVLVGFTTILMNLLAATAEGIQWVIAKAVGGINILLEYYNKVASKLGLATAGPIKFGGLDTAKLWRAQAEGMDEVLTKLFSDLGDMGEKGKPSKSITNKLTGLEDAFKPLKKTVRDFTDTIDPLNLSLGKHGAEVENVRRKYKDTDPEVIKLKESLKYTWENGLAKLAEYRLMVQDGVLDMEEFKRVTDNLNLPFSKVESGDPLVDQMASLKKQTEDMESEYKKMMEIQLKYSSLTKAQLEVLERNHLLKQTNFEQQRKQLVIAAGQGIADSLVSIAESLAGKQSGIYKAMFAVSKAFAIADAIVQIQGGIAKASNLPWPLNLGAMASVAAATASIVANIQAVGMSFEGGGMLPNRDRTGGVDGRGGMMMIGHPGEVILDPRKGQGMGGVVVEIHNHTDAQATVSTEDGRIKVMIRKEALSAVSDDLRKGGGPVSDSFETAYKMQRGRG